MMKRRRPLLLTITVVLTLCGACGVWLHVQKQQYARNQKLIDAVLSNDTKTALALVNAGADPNTRPNQPLTFGFRVLVDRLLRRTQASASDSSTAFLYACGSGFDKQYDFYIQEYDEDDHYDLVQAMLAHGADLRLRTPADHTALWGAVCLNRPRVVKLLLEQGANVNEQYRDGETLLIETIQRSHPKIVALLLSHNTTINKTNNSGDTALHRAAWLSDDITLFRQLLAQGADPTLRNKSGQTAIEIAQQAHHPVVAALLRRGGKDTSPATNRH